MEHVCGVCTPDTYPTAHILTQMIVSKDLLTAAKAAHSET